MPAEKQIINPNEHLDIPDWVQAEYFEEILRKDEPDFAKVINFQPTAAIPPGENFTSVMIRVHMDVELKDGSVIPKKYVLKTMLDDERGGKFVKELMLFPKEIEMYQKYLPAFEELYKEAGLELQLAPKCLFTETRGKLINFVFEDLKQKNFQNVERTQGFDMTHMRLVLRRLAEFHAASTVYEERHGAYPEDFQHGFVSPNADSETQDMIFNTRVKSYKAAMKLWGLENAEKYIEKFPTFEQYNACGRRTLDIKKNTFNVLNHGDFWSSNIMFDYKADGAINELLFLDFQICKWGSPAEDLLFFISISAAKDIRVSHFDELVEIYYERLIECLKLLKYGRRLPKLRELHMDLYAENTTFYAFFACFNHLVAVLLPTDKDSNIHSLMRPDEIGDKFRMRAYTNPDYVAAMKDLFPFFHRRGLFNFGDYDYN